MTDKSQAGRRTSAECDHPPLLTAEQMRRTDAAAINRTGIPGAVLMERAGMGVAEFLLEHFCGHHCFVVLCGPGNNGGDGFVAARHLADSGADVSVFATAARSAYKDDALTNLKILRNIGIPVAHAPSMAVLKRALADDCVIVDAIFGTGFAGEPRGRAADFIETASEAAERFGQPVVAVDIASGVDASTGEIARQTLPADATVTFHLPKVGHFVEPGSYYCGDLILVDIGIPASATVAPDHFLTGAEQIAGAIPPKMEYDHKFSVGRVLVVGGSTGLTGAVCLASEAALRAGAGVVTAGVPATLNAIFEQKLTEVMTAPVADDGSGQITEAALPRLLELAESMDCVAVGPGIGRLPEAAALVNGFLARSRVPVVLDADGLGALAGKPGSIKRRKFPTVLTPHTGELGRLLGLPAAEVAMQRLRHARAAARKTGATVLLKGAASLVTDGNLVMINSSGNPGLATAGSGDVLTGILAALLAKGMEPLEAAAAAAYLHGTAGDLAAADTNADNLIASDLIDYLPLACAALYGGLERGAHETSGGDRHDAGPECGCGGHEF